MSEAVVLLADEWLLQLPLEALNIFAVPQITSLSRDFSLQFHYHRVHPAERSGKYFTFTIAKMPVWIFLFLNIHASACCASYSSTRAVFKCLSKVITWLRLLRLMIVLEDSCQFFSQWEAKPKPIAPCTLDFSRALSKFQIIARNCDWFIALFALSWLVGGMALVLVFRQSFENRSITWFGLVVLSRRFNKGNELIKVKLAPFHTDATSKFFSFMLSRTDTNVLMIYRQFK